MATISLWKGVGVSMQSAIAATQNITGITNVATNGLSGASGTGAVVSVTAHGYSNGDFVVLQTAGMRQTNGRIFRVAGALTNSFVLENIDSTGYDVFASGGTNTAAKLTMGTTISTLLTINASGGDNTFVDTTLIHDSIKSQVPGQANPLNYNFDTVWDPADAGFAALKSANDAQAQRAFVVSLSNGKKVMFYGYVGFSGAPVGQTGYKVTTPLSVSCQGQPSVVLS